MIDQLGPILLAVAVFVGFYAAYELGRDTGLEEAVRTCEKCGETYTMGHYSQHHILSKHPGTDDLVASLKLLEEG